jgi:hypothetical protein
LDISVKDPTPGTFHRHPVLKGWVELEVDAALERVLEPEPVAELALVDEELNFMLDVEVGALQAFVVVESALSWCKGWGTPSTALESRKGMRLLNKVDIFVQL